MRLLKLFFQGRQYGQNLTAGILLVVLLAACSIPEAVVQRAPTGEILFQDDYSDPATGWDKVSAEAGETNYVDGSYRIWVNEPYTDLLANPNLEFKDVHIEVEATRADGPEDNVFGVICRSNPAGSQYYFFVISSDGYYGIGKVDGPDQKLLNADKMMPSESIHQKNLTNVLRAECVGDRLGFFVNGEKLAEVQDNEYTEGDIGLTAGTFDRPNVDILFDNLIVTKP